MITFEGPQFMWTNPSKKSRHGSDPPPSWQCLYFGNFWSGNPSLMAASIVNASGMFEVIQDAVEALECYCGTLNATICRGPSRQHWWQLHFFYVPCSLWLTKFEILEFVQRTISPPWKWHKTQMFYHSSTRNQCHTPSFYLGSSWSFVFPWHIQIHLQNPLNMAWGTFR